MMRANEIVAKLNQQLFPEYAGMRTALDGALKEFLKECVHDGHASYIPSPSPGFGAVYALPNNLFLQKYRYADRGIIFTVDTFVDELLGTTPKEEVIIEATRNFRGAIQALGTARKYFADNKSIFAPSKLLFGNDYTLKEGSVKAVMSEACDDKCEVKESFIKLSAVPA